MLVTLKSILVPRVESINNSSKRGHGGIALFYKKHLKPGIITVEIDPSGFICVILVILVILYSYLILKEMNERITDS